MDREKILTKERALNQAKDDLRRKSIEVEQLSIQLKNAKNKYEKQDTMPAQIDIRINEDMRSIDSLNHELRQKQMQIEEH